MSARRFDLIALGECMVELYATQPLGSADVLHRSCGGDVLNALVAAARLGGRTGFITRVGDDPFGPALLGQWQREGIDVAQAPLVAGENGVYFISLLADGEREFTYRRANSAASQLTAAGLDAHYIAAAHCILLSGITQALAPSAREATLAAARIAREHGVKVAYDPNYRPRLWAGQGGLAAARAALLELLPLTDFLLPSYPADVVLLDSVLPDAGPAAVRAAAAQFALGGAEVAMKCGADGSLVVQDGVQTAVSAVPAPQVVDTTGAGDAWNGAYLLHRLQGTPPARAAALANGIAADKLRHRGAIPPLPDDQARYEHN